jgi:hypothetical protein
MLLVSYHLYLDLALAITSIHRVNPLTPFTLHPQMQQTSLSTR